MPALPTLLRATPRVLLSSHVTNGITAALGLLLVSWVVHLLLGPAAAAAATVGVIVVIPPDQPAPRRGKFTHLLPGALLGPPLFLAVELVHDEPLALTALLVTATFAAFLGAAWGKRGLPVSIAVMFAMIFALAAPPPPGLEPALRQAGAFALGAFGYLLWGTAANSLLNPRYRVLTLVDSLQAVARLMRTQARTFATPAAPQADTELVGRLMQLQAALADQLQSARNVLLESPRTQRRLQLAGMLLQLLDMRDHLVACALDLDALRAQPQQQLLLQTLAAEVDVLAQDLEALADALLFGRQPAAFARTRPPLAIKAAAEVGLADVVLGRPDANLLGGALARRVGHIHEEVARLYALARGEREPDVEVVRVAWQMFVSPTQWTWRPFLALWRWDAPPLRHAIRAALAIAAGQALAMALPWGTHEYWILLTIVVVLRGSLAQTLERRNSRVAGTLLGCALAGIVLYAHLPAGVLLLAVAVAQGIAHAFAIRRYLVTAIAATVLALLQAHLLAPDGSPVFEVAERVADTAIGVAIAWIFSYVLPSWERSQIGALVARTLAAQQRHAQLALGLGHLRTVDSEAELAWRLARREAYDSLSALVQATQRAFAEPRAVRPRVADLERVLGHGYQLLAQLTAIKTMLRQRRDRLDIAQLQAPLQQAADAIAAALTGSGAAPREARGREEAAAMLDLPDPFERDLNPWLLRRLRMAVALSRDLQHDAKQALLPADGTA